MGKCSRSEELETDIKRRIEIGTLAFCIAFFPSVWAVLAPYFHIMTGGVALICAGVYVANGNQSKHALSISIGFILGDVWACLALKIIDFLKWNESVETFITLFVLGGAAVMISSLAPKWIFCPAWLCGWAIGLIIMIPLGWNEIGTYPLQIGVAMLVGVWYAGVFLDLIQKKAVRFIEKMRR